MEVSAAYIKEAIKITSFCLLATAIFYLLGVNSNTILVLFNIAVMSAAATFSPERKKPIHLLHGAVIITISILAGGVIGYYFTTYSTIISILYATLAFLLFKNKYIANIYITGALTFLIFKSLPFNINTAIIYGHNAILLIIIFLASNWLLDHHCYKHQAEHIFLENINRKTTALISLVALSVASIVSHILQKNSNLQHLYWISLTILLILQSSSQGTIKIAFKRSIVNTAGAILTILIMSYLLPTSFLPNLLFLSILLFAIFAFGRSYMARTLFIEMFVLSFTHLLGGYHNSTALDRIILTLLGSAITIISYLLINLITNKKTDFN